MTTFQQLDALFERNNGILKTSQVLQLGMTKPMFLFLCQTARPETSCPRGLSLPRCLDGCHVPASPPLCPGGFFP